MALIANPLLARFADEPCLIEPSQQQRFEACIAAVATHERAEELLSERADAGDDFWSFEPDSFLAWCRPYNVVGGVLQIPVKGVLLNNFPYQLGSWATGYEYIWQAFKRGCADFAIGTIKGIALVCDTPGGMVAGCFDARDRMLALKAHTGVPVAGFAHEAAYSAGYAMITVADVGQIYVSRTGGVGSIGVVTSHLDVSGAMEKGGYKLTFIVSDPSKVEGNPYEPLSAEAKARIQSRIDELYAIFVAAVVESRGISEEALRTELKAYTFTATQAVSNGLADHIGSLEDAVSAFAGFLDDQSNNGDEEMAESATGTVDQAAHELAVSNARAEGHAAGVTEGEANATTRIGAILGSEEAKGRETQAQHFAFKTKLSAEDAIASLAAAPAAVALAAEPAATVDLSGAMTGAASADVGAGASGDKVVNEDDPAATLALIRGAGLTGFSAPAAQ